MFCPKCGAQNLVEQKYCRGCGHNLTGHQAALEGRLEDATTNIKKGSGLVAGGFVVVGVCKLNILLNYFLGGDMIGVIINILLAILIAVPMIVIGLLYISNAKRNLNPKDDPRRARVGGADGVLAQSPAAPDTDRSITIPAPVTEHTTLDLKTPEQTRRESSVIRQGDTVRN